MFEITLETCRTNNESHVNYHEMTFQTNPNTTNASRMLMVAAALTLFLVMVHVFQVSIDDVPWKSSQQKIIDLVGLNVILQKFVSENQMCCEESVCNRDS